MWKQSSVINQNLPIASLEGLLHTEFSKIPSMSSYDIPLCALSQLWKLWCTKTDCERSFEENHHVWLRDGGEGLEEWSPQIEKLNFNPDIFFQGPLSLAFPLRSSSSLSPRNGGRPRYWGRRSPWCLMGISPSLLPLPFDTRRQNERALEKRREKGRKKKEGLIEGRSLACSIRLFLQADTAQCAVAVCHSERVSDFISGLRIFLPCSSL